MRGRRAERPSRVRDVGVVIRQRAGNLDFAIAINGHRLQISHPLAATHDAHLVFTEVDESSQSHEYHHEQRVRVIWRDHLNRRLRTIVNGL
jgi:hypothetical protein